MSASPPPPRTSGFPPSPSIREVFLGLVQLQLVVEGHEAYPLLGSITEVRGLLAGVGVDDAIWTHTEVQDGLDLILKWRGRKRGGEYGERHGSRQIQPYTDYFMSTITVQSHTQTMQQSSLIPRPWNRPVPYPDHAIVQSHTQTT